MIMEFDLKICGLNEAPNIAYGWATRVVSIIGTEGASKPDFSSAANHYTAVFDDDSEKGYVEATYNDIKNILNFTADIKERERVLIHCHAGLSCSPGIAYLVCAQHGKPPAQALITVRHVSHPLSVPNKRIVSLGEDVLNLGNAYSKFLNMWLRENHLDWS